MKPLKIELPYMQIDNLVDRMITLSPTPLGLMVIEDILYRLAITARNIMPWNQ